jgi:hypothetical protein
MPLEVQRGSRRIVLPMRNIGGRSEWLMKATHRPLYRRERSGTHCTGDWVGPVASTVGTGGEKKKSLAPTGV